MSTAALISEEEYLHTDYQPDCEFEDGVLIERNGGEKDRSKLQAVLTAFLVQRRKLWNIEVFTEQRVRIRTRKYMIPDICVVQRPEPDEQVFTQPPLIWIEILSPEDRPLRINEKVRQLLEFGVPNVWVIDPQTFEAEMHTPAGSRAAEDGVLRVEGTPVEVSLRDLDK